METKVRKPLVAGILALIAPGLGQMYNGQLIKGILVSLVLYCAGLFLILSKLPYTFTGIIVVLSILLVLFIVNIVEAVYTATKRKEMILKSYNKWYFYILFVIIIGIFQFTVEEVGKIETIYSTLKPYKIPTVSMEPTVMAGDRIVADMQYYTKNKLQKEDIIIMQNPEKPSVTLIKRVIATEGDIIESKDKIIYLNGKAIEEGYIQHIDKEILSANKDQRDNFGPFKIPPGSMFVMGDNRDNTYDSRYAGNIDMELVKGKVLYIFWSHNMNRIGLTVK